MVPSLLLIHRESKNLHHGHKLLNGQSGSKVEC